MRLGVRPIAIVGQDGDEAQETQVAIRQRVSSALLVGKLRGIAKQARDHTKHRVLVVDDSIVPRTAARAMLSSAPDLNLVGEAASGAEALRWVDSLKDRKSTRLNSSHMSISYAVFCLKKKKNTRRAAADRSLVD